MQLANNRCRSSQRRLVYVADEDGDMTILKHGKTLAVVSEINCENSIYSTPVATGNTLYIATKSKLLAIQQARLGGSGDHRIDEVKSTL